MSGVKVKRCVLRGCTSFRTVPVDAPDHPWFCGEICRRRAIGDNDARIPSPPRMSDTPIARWGRRSPFA